MRYYVWFSQMRSHIMYIPLCIWPPFNVCTTHCSSCNVCAVVITVYLTMITPIFHHQLGANVSTATQLMGSHLLAKASLGRACSMRVWWQPITIPMLLLRKTGGLIRLLRCNCVQSPTNSRTLSTELCWHEKKGNSNFLSSESLLYIKSPSICTSTKCGCHQRCTA